MSPPQWLVPGTQVSVWIDKIGTLKHGVEHQE